MNKRKMLMQLPIFEGLSPETIEKLMMSGNISEVQKGTMLIRAREPLSSVFIQLSGKSVIYNLTHSGKRKILFIFGCGELLNENVFNSQTSSVYCETFEKSKVFEIPVAELTRLMTSDFILAKNILSAQEKKIWRLSHQLKNSMSSIYLEKKLAAKLWKLSRDFGIWKEDGLEIDMNLTITFLADMLGAPRETTSRTCTALIEQGLIKIYKKRITLPNPDVMAKFFKHGKENERG